MGKPGFPITPTRWEGLGGRSPHAGGWGNQVPPYSRPREGLGGLRPHAGEWGNQVPPYSRPREGLGGRSPCAGVRGNRVSPLPPPGGRVWEGYALTQGDGEGLGGRSPCAGVWGNRVSPLPPPGGRVWEGYALTQGDGGTRFPHTPARGRVWEGAALPGTTFPGAGVWGNQVSPLPPPGGRVWEGYALTHGDGGTRFPHTPAHGRVWEGAARAQGYGETGFPHYPHPVGGSGRATPSRRGMGEPGSPILPPAGGFGRAQPVRRGMGKPGFPITPTRWEGLGGLRPHAGGWGNQVPPYSRPREGLGGRSPPRNNLSWSRGMGKPGFPITPTRWEGLGGLRPHAGGWGNPVPPYSRPREGLGGRSPPRNNRMFIAVLCGAAAWTSDG